MPTPKIILKFYKSKEWQRARNLKIKSQFGICEQCGKAGWEVHHITPLTLDNVDRPAISLSLDNLELLCTSCHNKKREGVKEPLRSDVKFDKSGNIIPKTYEKVMKTRDTPPVKGVKMVIISNGVDTSL